MLRLIAIRNIAVVYNYLTRVSPLLKTSPLVFIRTLRAIALFDTFLCAVFGRRLNLLRCAMYILGYRS